jgi:uncharacterized protein YbaR (Trm112 family)
MALSEELQKIIVCPKCKGELIYREEKNKLDCRSCRLFFRVEDDVPILLIEEAERY